MKMIEHEVVVIGDTISAHITAALLAKKGLNVGWVRNNGSEHYEIGNIWLGPTKPFDELAEVLGLNIGLKRCRGFYVYKEHRAYMLPISNLQLLAFRYFPLSARFKVLGDLLKLKAQSPEDFSYYTARDAFEKLRFDNGTAGYLLALAGISTALPWAGIDAITLFSTAMATRVLYPEIYSIQPDLEHLLNALKEIYAENEGAVYESMCRGVSISGGRCVAALLEARAVEAKAFVLSAEAHTLASLLSGWENPLLKEFEKRKTTCLDVKLILKEKMALTCPLVFAEYPLIGFMPSSSGIESGGRVKSYWRYVFGGENRKVDEVVRKFRVILARAYPNFWSNVEGVEHRLVEKPLPYYKKLPQHALKNLIIGTRNVYGNGLRDEVRAGIEAFRMSYRLIAKP